MRGSVDCFIICNDDTKQEASRHPTQFFSTSMAILSVGFPPVGDDAFFSLLPWIYLFYFFFFPDYSLSITPSSFPFFLLFAFPASVLGMYFLGDGMDRDRFGGFGHDLCAAF